MKKSILVVLGVLFIAAVAGGLFYADRLSYGDGYSEQQRKLWNERRDIYPFLWVLYRCDIAFTSGPTFLSQTMGTSVDSRLVQDTKKKKNESLKKRQQKLCEQEKLICNVDFKKPPNIEFLNSEEITPREFLERARRGDGDACLEMALHVGWPDSYSSMDELMTWRRVRDLNTWLDKAMLSRRPGALFLKHFGELTRKQLNASVMINNGHVFTSTPSLFDGSGLPGYDEFLQCMRSGDLLVYRVAQKMASGNELKEVFLLKDALRAQAHAGDVRAMEKLAKVSFDRSFFDWQKDILEEMNSSFWNIHLIEKLPRNWRSDARDMLISIGLLDAMRTKAVREFQEVADYARMAAERGSLAGMFYWLQVAKLRRDYFNQDEWEAIPRYYRILLENSYAPLLLGIMKAPSGGREMISDWLNPLEVYFDYQSNEQVKKAAIKLLHERGLGWGKLGASFVRKDATEMKKFLDEELALRCSDYILMELLLRESLWKCDDEKKSVFVNIVRECASEGDPYAQFTLGFLYEQGRGVVRDFGEAWSCYSKAYDALGDRGMEMRLYPDPMNEFQTNRIHFQALIRMFMLSMVVHHPEFSECDEKRAYGFVTYLEGFSKSSGNAYLNYLLGRVYEDGIGTPPDKEKALEYYMRGRDHPACAEGCERVKP